MAHGTSIDERNVDRPLGLPEHLGRLEALEAQGFGRVGSRFYSHNQTDPFALSIGLKCEGLAWFSYASQVARTVPLFSWYHELWNDHLLTLDPKGETAQSAGYKLRGVATFVFHDSGHGDPALKFRLILHRWYNDWDHLHFFTLDPAGEKAPYVGYHREGGACWVHPLQQFQATPVWRFHRP